MEGTTFFRGQSQVARLFALLSDNKPHSTPEILEKVYGGSHLGIARISARIFDINQKLRPLGQEVQSTQITKTIWEYQIKPYDSNKN